MGLAFGLAGAGTPLPVVLQDEFPRRNRAIQAWIHGLWRPNATFSEETVASARRALSTLEVPGLSAWCWKHTTQGPGAILIFLLSLFVGMGCTLWFASVILDSLSPGRRSGSRAMQILDSMLRIPLALGALAVFGVAPIWFGTKIFLNSGELVCMEIGSTHVSHWRQAQRSVQASLTQAPNSERQGESFKTFKARAAFGLELGFEEDFEYPASKQALWFEEWEMKMDHTVVTLEQQVALWVLLHEAYRKAVDLAPPRSEKVTE